MYIKNYKRKDSEQEQREKENQTKIDKNDEDLQNEQDISDLKRQMPLPEGVLKVNLGIPIIVVCNKVDLLLHGDKA